MAARGVAVGNRFLARSLRAVDERRIAANRRRIDRNRLFKTKTVEIMRPPRFGAGARQIEAAEGLGADDGADHIAIDIAISRQPPF